MTRDDIMRMTRTVTDEQLEHFFKAAYDAGAAAERGEVQMSDAKAATPHRVLIEELMDSRIPKTEREHAAAREIERLRQAVRDEREACARFLESGVDLKGLAGDAQMQAFCGALLIACAKSIRARGGAE